MTTSSAPHRGEPDAETAEVAGETAEVAGRVRVVLGRLARQLRLHQAQDRLTSTQLATLFTIEQRAPLRIGDLAAAESISAATMTRVVAALAERGLVERRADPDDGRACQVLLSPRGSTELARLRTQRNGYLVTRLGECTPEQRAALAAALPVLETIARDAAAVS